MPQPEAHTKKSKKEVLSFPHIVKKGSSVVTIYRIVNAARGEVFEVTWFKEGKRNRKAFRDSSLALKHADDTAKALDSGKSESLALSGTELESYRTTKRVLLQLENSPPLHSAMQEYVAAKKLLEGLPLLLPSRSFWRMFALGT